MKAKQIRKFDMLRRVQQFLDAFATQLGAVNATAARRELDTLVQEMGANESMQAASTLNAKSQTAIQVVLRRELVKHSMRPLATIAAAHLREMPGFKALQMPPKGVKVALLVQHATAMRQRETIRRCSWRTAVRRISLTSCWRRRRQYAARSTRGPGALRAGRRRGMDSRPPLRGRT